MTKTVQSPGSVLMTYLDDVNLSFDPNFFEEALSTMIQLLMEFEVSRSIEAGHYERTSSRMSYRNGYRERWWQSRFGTIRLRIPKLRQGSYYPSFLDSDGHTEGILLQLIQDALVLGAQMEHMDAMLHQLGLYTLKSSDVGDLCAALDDAIDQYRNRPLKTHYPYIWLDVLDVQISHKGRASRRVIALAVGMDPAGGYELLGYEVAGSGDDFQVWQRVLDNLAERGIEQVHLVISNAFDGVKRAVHETFTDARWQYCRAYFLQDLLAHVPAAAEQQVVEAVSRLYLETQAPEALLPAVVKVISQFSGQAAAMLLFAAEDLLVYRGLPIEHHSIVVSTRFLQQSVIGKIIDFAAENEVNFVPQFSSGQPFTGLAVEDLPMALGLGASW